MPPERVVIVGASVSGLTVAETLRAEGYQGELVLIGAELHEPYDRPPLSKQLLSGAWEPSRLTLLEGQELDKLGLDLRLGTPAVAAATDAKAVTLADGTRMDYDALVIATGVVPNTLPYGHDLHGVHILRTLDDALRLRARLTTARSIVVIGAGFLGAEVAAVARMLGVAVTLVDPLPLPLVRVLGTAAGTMLADVHREHGVDVRCGTSVRTILGEHGTVHTVVLDDGTEITADTVLVAIGSKPATDWLAGSGVPLGQRGVDECDGVLCDGEGRALPDVYAVGDVAAWWDARAGRRHRIEHRLTAAEHGRIVGRALLRPEQAPAEPLVPYFWSDQYDLKLQVYGLPDQTQGFEVVEGSLADRRFVAAYESDGVVTAVLGCKMPRQLRAWRQVVASATPVHEAFAAVPQG